MRQRALAEELFQSTAWTARNYERTLCKDRSHQHLFAARTRIQASLRARIHLTKSQERVRALSTEERPMKPSLLLEAAVGAIQS